MARQAIDLYNAYMHRDMPRRRFHNDSSQSRYDVEAAALAWQRTLAFFDNYLV